MVGEREDGMVWNFVDRLVSKYAYYENRSYRLW
jgi:hypothetical protein